MPPSTPSKVKVSEQTIRAVVDDFYTKVRGDDLLGPVFDKHVEDWGPHLNTMCDFWSAALNRTGRYRGRPGMVHLNIREDIETEHFSRWLELFSTTVRTSGICSQEEAEEFMRMANGFGMGISQIMRLSRPTPA